MKTKYLIVLICLVTIVAADQLTKTYIQDNIPEYKRRTIIPNYFDLTYICNTGAAFGFLSDKPASFKKPFFLTVSGFAILFILIFLLKIRPDQRLLALALAMVLGGAIGNLIDRVMLGKVVDFISLHVGRYYWPAFNVADIAIVCGVGLLILEMIILDRDEDPGKAADGSSTGTG
ncbi:signal peptidase II [Thermodesulfobacteriota bacterium]